MFVVLAQVVKLMGREIGDQKPPAGGEHPGGLGDGGAGVVKEMQDLMKDGGVQGARRERQLVQIPLLDPAVVHP